MGQALRFQEDAAVAELASVKYRSREVPGDWYVDPADPAAAERYLEATRESLEDQATALLADHEAQENESLLGDDDAADGLDDPPMELHRPSGAPAQPLWIGLPGLADYDDEGELGWQGDALCAQTDPEAFFPEKGGSTRDAKKVCGACNVRAQCLEYALANDERFGIWGGLSERERRRLRKRAV